MSLTQHFEKVEETFSALLADLSKALTASERLEVTRFIDVGEYGIALETLAAIIVEEGKTIPERSLDEILNLANMMGIRNAIIAKALSRRVVD